jgi:hypothetical protein
MAQHGHEYNQVSGDVSLSSPMNVLKAAIKAVPAVKYALGIAGISAAGAIVVSFLGSGRGAVIVLGGLLVAMVLLFVFARLIAAQNGSIVIAALVLMWMVLVFFGIFLAFTVTAVAFRVPVAWAEILDIADPARPMTEKDIRKQLEVPRKLASAALGDNANKTIVLTRILPKNAPEFAERDKAMRGGGAFFSFVRDDHEYGSGSDIGLDHNAFNVGFAGADYGFLLNAGAIDVAELGKLSSEPPKGIDSSRQDAWKFMWTYAPPQDITDIRKEQKRSDGFSVGGANLARNAIVAKGNLYLLRSVLIRQSDVLVALLVTDVLDDGSVVIAWRTLRNFDTPISTGRGGSE